VTCRLPTSWVTPCAQADDKPRAKFRLNRLQLKIHRTVVKDGCRFTAIVGGWGGGKTGELLFLAKHFALMRPGRTVLVITDTAERYIKVLVPEAEKWLRPSGFVHRVRERRWVHHGTGSSIVFVPYYRPSTRSSSHNPLEGINADANVCLMDEAQTLSPEAAIKATGRLRAKGYPPQMVIFGLPVWGAWWADMAEREGGEVIRGTSMANADNLEPGFFESAKARLTDAEYRAMVLGEPQAPEGLIYSCWRPTAWPDGNLMPDKAWRYDERMEGRIGVDPGVEKPHALIMVHDHARNIDVIVAEVGGERMADHELIQRILAVAWPREHAHLMPRDGRQRVLLDGGAIDRAAKRSATSMQSPLDVRLRSWMELVVRKPGPGPEDGLGLPLRMAEGVRTIIVNGISCVIRWMSHHGERRLLCLESVWDSKPGNSDKGFRKALETYMWKHGQPVKNGVEDPLDALRYMAVWYEWVAPIGSVEQQAEESRTRAAGMVRSMDGWAERGGGGFSRGR